MSSLEKMLKELQGEEPMSFRGGANASATRKQMQALEPLFVDAMSKRGRNGKYHTGRSFYEKVKDTPEFAKLRAEYGQSEAKYRTHFITVFNDFREDCVARGLMPPLKNKSPSLVKSTPKFHPSTPKIVEEPKPVETPIETTVEATAAPAPTPVVEAPKSEVPAVRATPPRYSKPSSEKQDTTEFSVPDYNDL